MDKKIKPKFLNLKGVPVVYNKKNGQLLISLPKKKLKNHINKNGVPKTLSFKVFKW